MIATPHAHDASLAQRRSLSLGVRASEVTLPEVMLLDASDSETHGDTGSCSDSSADFVTDLSRTVTLS